MRIKHRMTGAVLFEHETTSIKTSILVAIKTKADLRGADLSEADLSEANLSWANLDFSSGISFQCSSFGFKADIRLAAQIAYHFCRIDFGDCAEAKEAQEAIKKLANQFHRVEECGRIE
jgi:uncharacterized protein YjbI with pentapeptide repeats